MACKSSRKLSLNLTQNFQIFCVYILKHYSVWSSFYKRKLRKEKEEKKRIVLFSFLFWGGLFNYVKVFSFSHAIKLPLQMELLEYKISLV